MKAFAELLNRLYFTYGNNAKMQLLQEYFKKTKNPDRGYAIGIMAGSLPFPTFGSQIVKELLHEQIDPYLFSLSYDYVGDLSETLSLLWQSPRYKQNPLPLLSEVVETFLALPKNEINNYLKELLNRSNEYERWALLKMGTGSLRIGVSARFIKQSLAQYGNKSIQEIELLWHGIQPPYVELFSWLESKSPKPDVSENLYFHPVMLAHALDEDELKKINPQEFSIERKYDGIRVQFISTHQGKALFSRTGDDICQSFPDLMEIQIEEPIILDGELVVKKTNMASFNDLQQRLNRKIPSKKLIEDAPAHIILYDLIMLNHEDMHNKSFSERRKHLETWFKKQNLKALSLSEIFSCNTTQELIDLRIKILEEDDTGVEGLMLKKNNSLYLPGRPSGQWYKWKRDPFLVDAVLMYAQRGQGKRSSFYSDYTFGLWHENQLLPIGKAYFGFTDEELKQLDRWIRNHTVQRFGPVREVERALVFEVAFEAVNLSTRHKSGYALRFPRINRIRWDKPAKEADELKILKSFLK